MTEHRFVAGPDDAGQRLDTFLAGVVADLSRSRIQKLIDDGHCTVGGRPAKRGWKLEPGDEVLLRVPDPEPTDLVAEPIPLEVVYEDADVLVINKPRGLVVHPAAGHWSGTLVHALLDHIDDEEFTGVGGELRPGIVHRLDKDTTGLLVVAKNDAAHQALSAQIASRTAHREYLALVHGAPEVDAARIEAPIGRHPVDRKRMAVNMERGRDATTHFRVLERFKGFALLACRLETGRTHQIRVHLAYIGHPVAGDPVYGPRKQALGLRAQALHAHRLGFYHPGTDEWMEFSAPVPDDFAAVLERLRAGE